MPTTITPADYYPLLYGDNTGQQFSFVGRNNGATSIGSYKVYWTLSQNGVGLPGYSETDTFANTATNGTNTFYYGTSATPTFDPSTLGLGTYVLRARMENTVTTEVVAEHQWNITVKDRDFGFVSSAGSPFTGQDTIAWPASLPVTSGAEYQLSQPESGDSARVMFVTLSSPPSDTVGTAQSLIANGCEGQLDEAGYLACAGLNFMPKMTNVFALASSLTPVVSGENLLAADPDAIISSVLLEQEESAPACRQLREGLIPVPHHHAGWRRSCGG